MKRLIDGFFMCIGMFTTIPIKSKWNEEVTNLVASFLLFIGGIIGIIWFLGSKIILKFNIPLSLKSIFIMIIPFLLTGFLHLDGFMDTFDAVLSRRDLKTKRIILKDSNVGSFSVIMIILLFLISLSSIESFIENKNTEIVALIYIPIFSRGFVSLALLNMKSFSENGYADIFQKNTKKTKSIFIITILILIFIIVMLTEGIVVVLPISILLISSIIITIYLNNQMKGISGDLCGAILIIGECSALVTMAIISGVTFK